MRQALETSTSGGGGGSRRDLRKFLGRVMSRL